MSEVHEMHGVAAEAEAEVTSGHGWVRVYDKHTHILLASDEPVKLTPAACRYLATKLRRLARIVDERNA